MAKKKRWQEPPQEFIKGRVVLPEVTDELEKTEAPVDIICSVMEGCTVDDVIAYLQEMGIRVSYDPEYHTDFYVFASLASVKQAVSLEKSAESGKQKRCINRVWLDKKMEACVSESQKTINAQSARHLFDAGGEGITWAVLDTGVDVDHAWFSANNTCDPDHRRDFTGDGLDEVGLHGTHVAGIIRSIAPQVKLWDFKVLGRNGGQSSWIIKAMHEIRRMNFESEKMVIHGVNLSLGGPVKTGSYGCGWSPECHEASRLMQSGVVVCVAAGNEGHKLVATINRNSRELEIFSTFMDIGITDPGNAEAVITVGSTHKTHPHAYGPSYFSSKGPTGDGRRKPDCLAPGERIESAKADGKTIVMDGTSMAAPHVSGALAVFMSAKPEFIGRSMEVKKILLDSCTDLGRDPYFQGAGLVDVLRMIQSV